METKDKKADQYQSSNRMVSMDNRQCLYACHADKLHPSFSPDIDIKSKAVVHGSAFLRRSFQYVQSKFN